MGRLPLSSALKTTGTRRKELSEMASREDNRRLAEAYNEAMGIGGTKPHDELTDEPDDFSA